MDGGEKKVKGEKIDNLDRNCTLKGGKYGKYTRSIIRSVILYGRKPQYIVLKCGTSTG